MEMIIGKTYQDKYNKVVLKIEDVLTGSVRTIYMGKVISSPFDVGYLTVGMTISIREDDLNGWKEVVVDSDGLVYQINDQHSYLVTVKIRVNAKDRHQAGDIGLDKISKRNFGSITVEEV